MSTYVLMRVLESAPDRYDLGIRLLTLGVVDRAYAELVQPIRPGWRVLDIGCGTGALTLRAARRGARVRGIDIDPRMLEIAQRRARQEGLEERVELAEQGVAELDAEEGGTYDAVTSGLCLSELSEDELRYTLEQVARILRPGGLLLVADEIRPRPLFARLLHALVRAPLVALTWLLTQQTTHRLRDLPDLLSRAGLRLRSMHAHGLGSLGLFVAERPSETGR